MSFTSSHKSIHPFTKTHTYVMYVWNHTIHLASCTLEYTSPNSLHSPTKHGDYLLFYYTSNTYFSWINCFSFYTFIVNCMNTLFPLTLQWTHVSVSLSSSKYHWTLQLKGPGTSLLPHFWEPLFPYCKDTSDLVPDLVPPPVQCFVPLVLIVLLNLGVSPNTIIKKDFLFNQHFAPHPGSSHSLYNQFNLKPYQKKQESLWGITTPSGCRLRHPWVPLHWQLHLLHPW